MRALKKITQRKKKISLLLQRGGKGSNPAIVTLEGAAKDQLLRHDRSSGRDDGEERGREEGGKGSEGTGKKMARNDTVSASVLAMRGKRGIEP